MAVSGVGALCLLSAAVNLSCREPESDPVRGRALREPARIVFIGPDETDPVWTAIRGGAARFGAQFPEAECHILSRTHATEDPDALLARAREFKPGAICIWLENEREMRSLAARCVREGLLTVTVGPPMMDVGAYGWVEIAWPAAAEMLGRKLNDLARQIGRPEHAIVGEGVAYILLHENGVSEAATTRYERFCAGAKGASTLVRVAERSTASGDRAGDAPASEPTSTAAANVLREMLNEYPHVSLVVTLTPAPWLERDPRFRLGPPNRLATLGAAADLWSRLRSGEAAALIGPLDGEAGYAAMQLAFQGVLAVPDAPRRVTVPCEFITLENLEDFARRYAEAAGWDAAAMSAAAPGAQPP